MPPLRRLLLIGLAGYLLFLVLRFPAATALGWFAPPTLQASAVEGSVWRGRAAAMAVADLPLGEIRWRFRPTALLGLGWRFWASRRPDGFFEGTVAVGPLGGVRLRDLRGALPLAAAGALLPQPQPSGQLTLEFVEVELVDGWPQRLQGTVNVAQLVINREPLGSYRLDLAGEDGRIDGQIRSLDGPLEVEGELHITPDRQYELRAAMTARPEASARLLEGLRFLPNDASGRRLFSLAGSL